jgi:hypothetical protein
LCAKHTESGSVTTHLVHVLVVAPRHDHLVKAAILLVDAQLCGILRVSRVRILLEQLHPHPTTITHLVSRGHASLLCNIHAMPKTHAIRLEADEGLYLGVHNGRVESASYWERVPCTIIMVHFHASDCRCFQHQSSEGRKHILRATMQGRREVGVPTTAY